MATQEEMLEGVKKHAIENYSKDGWDYVVECYDDSDILEVINDECSWDPNHVPKPCTTVAEAIKSVGEIVGIYEERRFAAQAASGELDYYGIVEHEGLVRKASLEET